MRASILGLFVLQILFLWAKVDLADGDSSNLSNYISWDDLRVDESRLVFMNGDGSVRGATEDGGVRVIVVEQHGRGDSTTVQGAVDMVQEDNQQRVKIYIMPGVYRERVYVPRSKPYISFIGKTNLASDEDLSEGAIPIITWNSKASDIGPDGKELGMAYTATLQVDADYFCASGITIENSVVAYPGGCGMQAVALRVDGDRAVFHGVRILGFQDTLLDNLGTHYFYRSYIEGNVDFICGRAKSLYEECVIRSKGAGSITAHSRDSPYLDTGYSFVNSFIIGSGITILGRPWGDYARVIFSYCYIDDIISREGWNDWNLPSRQNTSTFGEYQCYGGGADRSGRVPWSKSLSHEEVMPFLGKGFINGEEWLRL